MKTVPTKSIGKSLSFADLEIAESAEADGEDSDLVQDMDDFTKWLDEVASAEPADPHQPSGEPPLEKKPEKSEVSSKECQSCHRSPCIFAL